MALYIAQNAALSTTTALGAGTSYASGAKVALQLQIPDNTSVSIVEIGWSQESATSTATLLELVTTDAASTVSTGHTTTTVKPLTQNNTTSRLTMGTTGTGYGNGAITTNTTLRTLHKLYAPQQYVYTWPLGMWPIANDGSTETYVQFRVNTTATVNAIAWIIWNEE